VDIFETVISLNVATYYLLGTRWHTVTLKIDAGYIPTRPHGATPQKRVSIIFMAAAPNIIDLFLYPVTFISMYIQWC
jgi:hypothetical protein